ncbi:MAG: hypothetical protein PUJ51_24275 [Clostridiales bacterium]|uniref:hypothetical protein n=1 Tax=Terrisporobacter sp. TaxID=1965305 RepID=UPI002A5057D8|nr:hypothetical protein [Terrisporobacter sp.]MDD7757571.1 hypothetical protein [Clostridiales bacterium]MDY4137628.1 hypothetical protein [Terrisporobacter sp.]
MSFDEILDRLWFFDSEVFAHDTLWVFKKYRTHEEYWVHNPLADELDTFIQRENPILCGYNCNAYDKFILQACLLGYTPEEVKKVNDAIIKEDIRGWDLGLEYIQLPTMFDLFNEITPRKSLKELEGNLRLDITETTIPFDLPTKWTEEELQEVLYYCEHDVDALFSVFKCLFNTYKSKYIISQLGHMDPEKTLAMTNANITAALLGAKKVSHDDNFAYVYPDVIDKTKIPKEFLDYIDDLIEHNDLNYKTDAPALDLGSIILQTGLGGCHAFIKEGPLIYDAGLDLEVE